MNRIKLPCVLLLLLGFAGATPAAEITAQALTSAPLVDGVVVSDVAWRSVSPASDFTQVTPDEGQPATQKTEVYVGFTEDTLYIGAVLYDTEPDRIIVSDNRRDADLEDTDSFLMILDSYLDRKNGFVFGTNVGGAEYDGQVTNEGTSGFGSG